MFKTIRKFSLIIICCFGIVSIINGQAPAIQWAKCYGGSGEDIANSIKQTFDGGYIIAGTTNSNDGNVVGNHGNIDAWIVKIDNAGNIEWSRAFGGSAYDYANWIEQTKDSGYIVCGFTSSNDGDISGIHGGGDAFVLKLTKVGNIEWVKLMGGSKYDNLNCIKQTIDGGFIVLGESYSTDGDLLGLGISYLSAWYAKIDANGSLVWIKKGYSPSLNFSYFKGTRIIQTKDKGYLLVQEDNTHTGITGHNESMIYKTDSLGVKQWEHYVLQTGDVEFQLVDAKQKTDSSYIISVGNCVGDCDAPLQHISNSNALIWNRQNITTTVCGNLYGFYLEIRYLMNAIDFTQDEGIILGGNNTQIRPNISGVVCPIKNHDTSGITKDYFIVRLDSAGNPLWDKYFGGTAEDYSYDTHTTTDKGYIMAGVSYSMDGDVTGNHGGGDFWIVKLITDSLLPLKLHSFTALNENNNVLLNWKTDNEINVSHFNVQRSVNGKDFTTIGTIAANNKPSEYRFTDDRLPLTAGETTVIYYRLEMVDKDGSKAYSTIQHVNLSTIHKLSISPNPARDFVTVSAKNIQEIRIINSMGQVALRQAQGDNGMKNYTLNIQQLTKGLYLVQVLTTNGEMKTGKLVVSD